MNGVRDEEDVRPVMAADSSLWGVDTIVWPHLSSHVHGYQLDRPDSLVEVPSLPLFPCVFLLIWRVCLKYVDVCEEGSLQIEETDSLFKDIDNLQSSSQASPRQAFDENHSVKLRTVWVPGTGWT